MLEHALAYLRSGLCPIPLQPRTKIPLEPGWERYSHQKVTEEEVRRWWAAHPDANIGLVTGPAGGVFVLDVDGETGRSSLEGRPLPVTPQGLTGSGGQHIFFRYPEGVVIRNRVGFLPGLDIRGDRGQVVAPPSVHPSGTVYSWLIEPGEEPFADPPAWLLEAITDSAPRPARAGAATTPEGVPVWMQALWQGASEGTRNDTMARVAGHYVALLGEHEALGVCLAINAAHFKPPLPVEEVETVVASIARAERRKKQIEEYGTRPQEELEALPDDERQSIAREAVATALGVRVEAAYKYDTDPPSYELIIQGARVRLRNIHEMIEQRRLQARIADEIGTLIKTVSKDRWPSIAQALLDACEVREVEEATDRGRLEGWLAGYLEARPPEDEPSVGEGRDTPFWQDGLLMVNTTELRLWIKVEADETVSSLELATLLRRFGAVPVQVGQRSPRTGQVRNVRFWRLPESLTSRLNLERPKEKTTR